MRKSKAKYCIVTSIEQGQCLIHATLRRREDLTKGGLFRGRIWLTSRTVNVPINVDAGHHSLHKLPNIDFFHSHSEQSNGKIVSTLMVVSWKVVDQSGVARKVKLVRLGVILLLQCFGSRIRAGKIESELAFTCGSLSAFFHALQIPFPGFNDPIIEINVLFSQSAETVPEFSRLDPFEVLYLPYDFPVKSF